MLSVDCDMRPFGNRTAIFGCIFHANFYVRRGRRRVGYELGIDLGFNSKRSGADRIP